MILAKNFTVFLDFNFLRFSDFQNIDKKLQQENYYCFLYSFEKLNNIIVTRIINLLHFNSPLSY